MHNVRRIEDDRYAVILAGGNATRLMPLTRRITGRPIPKQFCPIIGESTLLAQTCRRVALRVSRHRTLLVLTRSHEDFYREQLRASPDPNLLIQPENRGTAPAILFALLRVAKLDPHAVVIVFPSDHYVDNEELFMCHADLVMRTANIRRRQLALLGIKPDRAEPGYGWIEPAGSLCEGSTLQRVARFWEKPPEPLARKLWRRGCLWNSFVMAGTARAFLTMTLRALPELKQTVAGVWSAIGTPDEYEAMEVAYADLPCRDFAADVLAQNAADLAIVPVQGLYWNDLGDPRRVYETLARMQIRPGWMTQRTAPNRADFIREALPQIRAANCSSNKCPRRIL
jgi:mannose-1-phosphate guanylyltransferase